MRVEQAMSVLRDFRRDWRRWNAAERIGAVSIMLSMVAMTAATLMAGHVV